MSDDLRKKAEARYVEAREKVSDAIATGRARADEAMKTAKVSAAEAARQARERAAEAAEAARQGARRAAKKSSEGLESNPFAALAGGLAVGAILGALIPRTMREDKLLGKTGKTLRSTANKAAQAARDAGKEQLDALGVNADTARAQVQDLVRKVGRAAGTAAEAATEAVRRKAK